MKHILSILVLSVLFGTAAVAQPRVILHKQAPPVPECASFAGDTVWFNRLDFYERMDRELISFTNMHTNTLLMLKRSKRCFALVVPILKRYGLPEDLKYLMAIESNCDPKAVSVAGAVGLWQFTKATAATYGLEVNGEVDERYDLEKETVAACKFLRDAYRKFGNWFTVAASYNAGQGGLARRVEDQQEDNALDLWLPEETSRYLFRLLAVKMFFEDPVAFGFSVPENRMYPAPPVKERVTVSGPVESWVDFAIAHGTTYAELRLRNLWIRSDHLTNKAGKSYTVIIP